MYTAICYICQNTIYCHICWDLLNWDLHIWPGYFILNLFMTLINMCKYIISIFLKCDQTSISNLIICIRVYMIHEGDRERDCYKNMFIKHETPRKMCFLACSVLASHAVRHYIVLFHFNLFFIPLINSASQLSVLCWFPFAEYQIQYPTRVIHQKYC